MPSQQVIRLTLLLDWTNKQTNKQKQKNTKKHKQTNTNKQANYPQTNKWTKKQTSYKQTSKQNTKQIQTNKLKINSFLKNIVLFIFFICLFLRLCGFVCMFFLCFEVWIVVCLYVFVCLFSYLYFSLFVRLCVCIFVRSPPDMLAFQGVLC